MKRFRIHIILLIFIISGISLFAQTSYRIASVDFIPENRTKAYFLSLAAEIEVGKVFATTAEIDEYLRDREQYILNNRVFETVHIEVQEGPEEEGFIPLHLTVRTTDTWNIIALPYAKYDTNEGFLLSIRGRDYNFLGTMETLSLNLNYEIDEGGEQYVGAQIIYKYPFNFLDFDWEWDISADVSYSNSYGPDFTFDNTLTYYLPVGPGKISIEALHGIDLENEDQDYSNAGDAFYFTESLTASYIYPLFKNDRSVPFNWTPSLNIVNYWDWDGIDLSDIKGTRFTLGNSFDFERIDWKGNFRKGYDLSLSNSVIYNFWYENWYDKIDFSAIGHTNWNWVGLSSRLSGFVYFNTYDTSAGDALRGIYNDRIDAKYAVFLNLDFPVRVIRFIPSKWINIKWMRLFNFEQQWSPFLDIGYSLMEDQMLSDMETWYSTGLEVITFPEIMRSFYFRISAGWDIEEVHRLNSLFGETPEGEPIMELFLGMGYHY